MARPRTRVAVLDGEELRLIKDQFQTCTFAYAQLKLADSVTYPSFQRVWQGKEVKPVEIAAVREGWNEWTFRMLQVLTETRKAPVEKMYTPGGSPAVEEEGDASGPFVEGAAA